MIRKTNNEWFDFFLNLMGYDFYYKGQKVPKYILYWSGKSSDRLLLNKTRYKLKKRI